MVTEASKLVKYDRGQLLAVVHRLLPASNCAPLIIRTPAGLEQLQWGFCRSHVQAKGSRSRHDNCCRRRSSSDSGPRRGASACPPSYMVTGIVKLNRLPTPTVLSTRSTLPWASMIPRVMARPSPVPRELSSAAHTCGAARSVPGSGFQRCQCRRTLRSSHSAVIAARRLWAGLRIG